jgi:hypothetical protein
MSLPRVFAYYGPEDLNLDLQFSRQFWEGDVRYSCVLYRLDATRTQVDDVYGETLAEAKVFFPPVEVTIVPNIQAVVNSYVVPGGLAKQVANVHVGFYYAELIDKACRPHSGDFMRYDAGQGPSFYELANVDELLSNNTRAGVPYYVSAVGVLVGQNAVPAGLGN